MVLHRRAERKRPGETRESWSDGLTNTSSWCYTVEPSVSDPARHEKASDPARQTKEPRRDTRESDTMAKRKRLPRFNAKREVEALKSSVQAILDGSTDLVAVTTAHKRLDALRARIERLEQLAPCDLDLVEARLHEDAHDTAEAGFQVRPSDQRGQDTIWVNVYQGGVVGYSTEALADLCAVPTRIGKAHKLVWGS